MHLQNSKNIINLEIEYSQKFGNDFKIIVSLLKNLDKKDNYKVNKTPFLPPFEDGLFITNLGSTHRLLFNKFRIIKDHFLVTSKEFEK